MRQSLNPQEAILVSLAPVSVIFDAIPIKFHYITVCLGSRNKSTPANCSLLKKGFGSKRATRVSHKEFNSLWTDIGKKEYRPCLGHRGVPG